MGNRAIKSYPEEYKMTSAQLALESNQSLSKTAKELGVSTSTLYGWVQKYGAPVASQGTTDAALQQELKRLKKVLAKKEEECEILKKASAYFATHVR